MVETYIWAINNKVSCINCIKNANNIKDVHECIKECHKNKIQSIYNYMILIVFCKYLKNKSQIIVCIQEIQVSEFLWIHTSNKSIFTAKRYKYIVVSFCNNFNKTINEKSETINIPGYSAKTPNYLFFHDILSKEEISRFLKTVSIYPHKNYYRDTLIIKLLLNTGIRVSELIYIKKKDICCENSLYIIRVLGKNKLSRIIAVSKKEHHAEIEYLKNLPNSVWLFTKEKNQLTRQYVYYLVKKMLKLAGINKNKNGPHLLRHTFATYLYKKEKDIILVQESLGHQSIQCTSRYIHLNMRNLKQMAEVYE